MENHKEEILIQVNRLKTPFSIKKVNTGINRINFKDNRKNKRIHFFQPLKE